MIFPHRFRVSSVSTEKLKYLKSKTGVTPNIICRFAISMALRDSKGVGNASSVELNGQEFNVGTLFGEHIDLYEMLLRQYVSDFDVRVDMQHLVAALVELGLHKMGHVKSIREMTLLAVKTRS